MIGGGKVNNVFVTKTLDRNAVMAAVSRILQSHRCRDWYCHDDESSMQLIDVLSQHSEDGTVSRGIEECDDLASDIVDEIFLLPNAPMTWKDDLAEDSIRLFEQLKKDNP
jgi:hypothetical protein